MFPSPIGGVPFDADFAPSVLFASLYAVLVLVGLFRLARPSTRTVVLIETFAFVVERVAIFALRAKQAKMPAQREDKNLTIYWQITFATGYISLYATALQALRCAVVRSTVGGTSSGQQGIPMASETDTAGTVSQSDEAQKVEDDLPRERFLYRAVFTVLALQGWVAVVLGIVGGSSYVAAETDATKAAYVRALRYATNALAFALISAMQGLALWAVLAMPRVRRKGAPLLVFGIGVLLNVVSIYRFAVLPNDTPGLLSTARGSLNSPGDKALFYVFHAAPELLVAAVLVCVDIRRVFDTGLWGDRMWRSKSKA